MNYSVKEKGEITIFELAGKFDKGTETQLEKDLETLISKGRKLFILNMKNVVYINSPGMIALFSIYRKVRKDNAMLVLCEVETYIKEAFRVTRLDKFLEVYFNEHFAIVALKDFQQ